MNLSFRARLIALTTVTVAASVLLVGWLVEANLNRSFDLANQARTNSLVEQFDSSFQQRGEQLTQRVESIANSETVLRIGLVAAQSKPDFAAFLNDASSIAASQQLDLLEILAADGTIISSAQWPARFGYKETWVSEFDKGEPPGKAFLKREELPEGDVLAIVAVRKIKVRDAVLYVAGGQRLDAKYFQTLAPPLGLRPMIYRFTEAGFSAKNFVGFAAPSGEQPVPGLQSSDKLAPLIDDIRAAYASGQTHISRTIEWTANHEDAEVVHSSALTGRNTELLGALIVATPEREQIRLTRHVRNVTWAVGLAGIIFGVLLSAWLAGRVTRPIEDLAVAATKVAQGDWNAHVDVASADEIGQLAEAFNRMTHELIAQRERLVQTERVAAWRELARRLAHELKNPLFPLQITVENLLRARESSPEQFEEVFRESTHTLLAELANLKNIVGRFSDFSKMPTPQLQPTDVNALLRETTQLFQAQLERTPQVKLNVELDASLPKVDADAVLLRRAFENLILNALDAMPQGGTITVRTLMKAADERVIVEVADSGAGLTPEECERLFTPYYTTKQFGTGLGLAIVQSVIADHGGTITVSTKKDVGTMFHVELSTHSKDAVT